MEIYYALLSIFSNTQLYPFYISFVFKLSSIKHRYPFHYFQNTPHSEHYYPKLLVFLMYFPLLFIFIVFLISNIQQQSPEQWIQPLRKAIKDISFFEWLHCIWQQFLEQNKLQISYYIKYINYALKMNFEADLYDLMIQGSPQVDTLRTRSINGNGETLQAFCNVIGKLLKNSNNHPLAYKQTNELLISAQLPVVEAVDKQILPLIAESHCREDLDEYIIFWRRSLPGTGTKMNYPNLYERLKKVQVKHPNRQLSSQFANTNRIFERNIDTLNSQRVQFFSDPDGDSFVTDSIDEEASSEIIEMDMQEIEQIRKNVQNGPIDELAAQQYLKKVKNFLSLKPKSLKKELSLEFNNDRIWAKQFIQNYDNYLNGGSLNLHKYFNKSNSFGVKNIPVQNKSYRQNIPITIHQDAEEVQYHEETFKKVNSKRYELTTQKLQPSLPKPLQQKDKSQMSISKPNVPKPIQIQIPIILKQEQVSYQLPGKPNVLEGRYTMVNSQYNQKPVTNMRRTQGAIPNFILSTEEMKKVQREKSNDKMGNSSQARPKIFGNASWRSKQQQPQQDQLIVTKHGKGQDQNIPKTRNSYDLKPINQNYGGYQGSPQGNQPNSPSGRWTILSEQDNRTPFNFSNSKPNQNYFMSANNTVTPINNKRSGYEIISPNTAFQNKTAYAGTSSKKLSQFNQEKKQRKLGLAQQELIPIQNYILKPYSQNFNEVIEFSKFRRNCLEDNFTLYASPQLLISCIVKRMPDSKVRIQMLYHNQAYTDLEIQTLYRVPKCLKVQKYSQISKRWILKEQAQHNFGLELQSFPLEPCILNLKYFSQRSYNDFKQLHPIIVSIPVTIRNFLQYLVLNEEEWVNKWIKWAQIGNFRITKHIILDKQVLREDELIPALKELTILSPVQGYSIKQFGGYCWQPNFNNLTFLLRISQRVENIMTLQILADRKIHDQDEIDYLEYCLNIWSMLLAKIDLNAMY